MKALVVAAYLPLLAGLGGFLLWGQPGSVSEVVRRPSLFDANRAMKDLRAIDDVTRRAGGRQVGSNGNLLTRDYLRRRFEEAGLQVYEQRFGDMLGGEMKNLVAVLPGEREETILVSAHHDTEGAGPAAVEGAAGLAVLLELARDAATAAKNRSAPPARTLIFASWDGESFGCAGSTRFVDSLTEAQRSRLRAVVSVDSVGWKDGTPVLHVLPYEDQMGAHSVAPDWLVTRVANAARRRGEPLPVGDRWLGLVYQVIVRAVDLGYYSDDRPFLAKGVPAVFVANFSLTQSYPESGTRRDTIEMVGAAQMGATGRSLEAAVTDLASADNLPPGEEDYLVFRTLFLGVRRLTGDQIRALAFLSLLPGALVLIRRRRDGGLTLTRVLFAAFGAIFVLATLEADAILFPTLFVPVVLAGPLLAVRSQRAVWVHLASLLPALLFAALLAPVYLTGSASLIRISAPEMAAIAGLILIGLAQAPLQYARLRPAVSARV